MNNTRLKKNTTKKVRFSCGIQSNTESTLNENSLCRRIYMRLSDIQIEESYWWEQRYGVNIRWINVKWKLSGSWAYLHGTSIPKYAFTSVAVHQNIKRCLRRRCCKTGWIFLLLSIEFGFCVCVIYLFFFSHKNIN